MTRIIMVRHGESMANKECKFAGATTDTPLMERGLRQAELMAEYVAANYHIANVYTSGLQRAYITGKCVADKFGLSVIVRDDLREIYGGHWEGCPFEDMGRLYPEEHKLWVTDHANARAPGGESFRELADRVTAEVIRIAEENPGKTVLLVSHASPVQAMYALALNGSIENIDKVPLASNASLTILNYDNGNWSCEASSVDSYLGSLRTALPENV